MNPVTIVNRTRESVLGSNVALADRWWLRARGFLRRPEPREGEGLLLNPCRAVHMVGMAFALDVMFVDRQGRVIALYPDLAPGRRTRWHARARYALELPAGTIEATHTRTGDLISWLPTDTAEGISAMTRTGVVASRHDEAGTDAEESAGTAAEPAGVEATELRGESR